MEQQSSQPTPATPTPAQNKGINVVDRAKNILITPKHEWTIIHGENTSPATITLSYILPMLFIGAVACFIGFGLIGVAGFATVKAGLVAALIYLVRLTIMVYAVAAVIEVLATGFGAEKNFQKSFQLAAYSLTAAYVAGIFFLFPALWIIVLLGSLYSLYPLYTGIGIMKKTPEDKQVAYFAVIILISIVVGILLGLLEREIMSAFNRPRVFNPYDLYR
jgi:hypothetical protein